MEPDNGAIVVDATSVGIRFHAVAPLHPNGNVHFSFSLSGNRRVEAAARLAWADETNKSGGLEFSSVPAEVIEQILNCCTMPLGTPRHEQKLRRLETSNALALPLRQSVTSRTPAISPEWKEGGSSLLAVQAVASRGRISRAANQRERHDPESRKKKALAQMPGAARLYASPERSLLRGLPLSRTTLTALLLGVLFSIPILFLTMLAAKIIHRPVVIAAPQTPVRLAPAVPSEAQPIAQQNLFQDPLRDLIQDDPLQDNNAQQNTGGLTMPPQIVPRKPRSAKSGDSRLSDSAKDRNGLTEHRDSKNAAGAEYLGLRSIPGGGNDGNGASRAKGIAATAPFGTAVSAPAAGDSGAYSGKLKTSGFAPSAVEFESPKYGANETVAASVQPLVVLDKPHPVYTEEARRLAIEGEVFIDVVFSASGQVRVVRLAKGLGHGLDEAAMNAAQRIRFEPALQNGQPVDVPATVHITFKLAF